MAACCCRHSFPEFLRRVNHGQTELADEALRLEAFIDEHLGTDPMICMRKRTARLIVFC